MSDVGKCILKGVDEGLCGDHLIVGFYQRADIDLKSPPSDLCWRCGNVLLATIKIEQLQGQLETALRLLGESKCPNGNCNRGTLRMFKGSSWDMENDLGPCPRCLQVSEVMK